MYDACLCSRAIRTDGWTTIATVQRTRSTPDPSLRISLDLHSSMLLSEYRRVQSDNIMKCRFSCVVQTVKDERTGILVNFISLYSANYPKQVQCSLV